MNKSNNISKDENIKKLKKYLTIPYNKNITYILIKYINIYNSIKNDLNMEEKYNIIINLFDFMYKIKIYEIFKNNNKLNLCIYKKFIDLNEQMKTFSYYNKENNIKYYIYFVQNYKDNYDKIIF